MNTTRILVVEDNTELREALCDTLSLAGYHVVPTGDGHEALRQLHQPIDLIVSDIQMPNLDGLQLLKKISAEHSQIPMVLMTAYGTIQQAVDAMREGAVDYLVKPFEAQVLVNMVSRYASSRSADNSEMLAEDPRSKQLLQIAARVAQTDATVMISGESGSGKEVLARYIHQHSTRATQTFVAINCAAIPENMLEATLFGYEKGAYTGAYKASPGKFEQAQGGTLLLDEITEMDMALQAKLLRVLQEREVERLGGGKTIPLDVRIIATSNRDVRAYVDAGSFREDLFYRLNVFPLHVAALRERQQDILPLARRLLERHCQQQKRTVPRITDEAGRRLLDYPWPGNVRELDNVLQRALILQDGTVLDTSTIRFETEKKSHTPPARTHLHSETSSQSAATQPTPTQLDSVETLGDELKQKEWHVIMHTIQSVQGSRKHAAERLGISQRTLRYKLARMREAGIAIPDKLFAENI
ncbi:MAG: sigma-54-dependent Fis family transcriptional regulator [Gammaproteobacteria bacterium]|nr:sigma-54-dependent Fis family transcriptional regulator [Gammaproteobacteria bacterium]